jgi:predicted Zn finger-like uncharacterized protein
MKIECPSCHLTGNINEIDIPPEGRELNCLRCKTSFHVAKPPLEPGNHHLMNICPVCQYSTFTDEMFAVCPKCGVVGDDFREIRRKQEEKEQMRREQELLHRSCRNPSFVMNNMDDSVPEPAKAPQPVRVTGLICISAGGALLCYGLAGLAKYYSKDWQSILSEPLLEPISKTDVFFRLGILPWLTTMFSVYFIMAAGQFLRIRNGSREGLIRGAWAGMAFGAIYEAADFINWVRISSSKPSFSYIAAGIMSSLFLIFLWSAPFFTLNWFLRSDRMIREFPEDQSQSKVPEKRVSSAIEN